MIKYLGSKRRLVQSIVELVEAVPSARTVVDLFSGTSRVGHALKRAGFRVRANDYAAYAHMLATCYVQADREQFGAAADALIGELQDVPPEPGYFAETFCEAARFFTPENGARVDGIRAEIERRELPPELRAIAIVALMEAADRVDSTVGVQMAYLKSWAPRARRPLTLRVPELLPRAGAGRGEAHMLDARQAARSLSGDVAYLDPPYNQHSYLANYHIWETLVRWDQPEAYGVARKREDTRSRKSDFNGKRSHREAMEDVVRNVDAGILIVSFNNEGHLTPDEMIDLLGARGAVVRRAYDSRRYVGSKIGVYNGSGERVGEEGAQFNKEFLFLAGDAVTVAAVAGTGAADEGWTRMA